MKLSIFATALSAPLTHGSGLVSGSTEHAAVRVGVEYYFTTAAAETALEADPAAYLPQLGELCTVGFAVYKIWAKTRVLQT